MGRVTRKGYKRSSKAGGEHPLSLLISAVIIWGTWGLSRDSVNLALQDVPEGMDLAKVKEYLAELPRVTAVHDLHIWPMSTTETALTAHLVRDVNRCDSFVLKECCRELHDKFEIQHATIQFETEDHDCDLAPEHRVQHQAVVWSVLNGAKFVLNG